MYQLYLRCCTLFCTLFISFTLFAQPSNDECSGAILLTSAVSCTNYSTTAVGATASSPAHTCTGPGLKFDVWYKFVASATSHTITVSNNGSNFVSPKLEVFSACGAALSCNGSATITVSSLTVSATYLVRVFTTSNSSSNASNAAFDICVTHPAPPAPPSNDDCSGATTLTMGSGVSGTLAVATASTAPAGCATGDPDDDVWYRFTATAANTSIALSNIGSGISGGTMMQLYSGTCAGLTSLACAGTTTLYATGLTTGNTYYVRVYSSATGALSNATFTITATVPSALSSTNYESGRMKEVFQMTTLSPASGLNDPWEITWGPDNYLWITEAKGYKVHRMDPATGVKVTVLDISSGSSFLSDNSFNVQFTTSQSPWPQGGFAGLAIHPKFLDPVTPKNYVYVSYVHHYVSTAPSSGGVFFSNRLVRFEYSPATGKLGNPVSLCDTLPGSSDHNSQRVIIAPVDGVDYLFYASGDMGAGQFDNALRPMKSQITASYEGKILRFLLEDDGESGLDKWIPNDNPFNSTIQSAVWTTGIRNNQGFAYGTFNGVGRLYGSSHGPFSDDELNILVKGKNYGHPNVIGYASDNNYNNSSAGSKTGSLSVIASETANASAIGDDYRDPLFSAYPTTQATINGIYNNQVNNGSWPSEGWSGLDLYTNNVIPGWKNSLIVASLKWGRILRFKLNSTGDAIVPVAGKDTISYFGSTNRFRDVAFAPNGRDLYVIMDKNATTSGPSALNPVVPACGGCVQKYSFLGYNSDGSGKSMIPTAIDVESGTADNCVTGTTITINSTNNNIWVPITGPDGNIIAEIKANGNNLGNVATSLYVKGGGLREDGGKRLYLNRNITITPAVQPSTPVSIRLYMTAAELAPIVGATNSAGRSSGVTGIGDIRILKNSDGCGNALTNAPAWITPAFAESFGSNYVLQASVSSFSSFYFSGQGMIILPHELITFSGSLRNNIAQLNWETANESMTSHFEVERSNDGIAFLPIGQLAAAGNSTTVRKYQFDDPAFMSQPSNVQYYRLKIVDLDGSSSYSNVISISYDPATTLSIFPNPIKEQMSIRFDLSRAEQLQLIVTDLHGRIVYQENRMMAAGSGTIDINTRAWSSGAYGVKLVGSGNRIMASKQVVKM